MYAHEGTYLPQRGWWTDTPRLDRLRKQFKNAVRAAPRRGVVESILAEALRPAPWRKDLWLETDYGAEVARMRQEEEDEAEDLRQLEEDEEGWEDEDEEEEFEDEEEEFEDEWEERANYSGHLREDFEDMVMYGIKPWDIDAYVSRSLLPLFVAVTHGPVCLSRDWLQDELMSIRNVLGEY